MLEISFSFAETPPYAEYSPILSDLPIVSYLHWTTRPEQEDAGIPKEAASILSNAIVAHYGLLFLTSASSQIAANEWIQERPGVWKFREGRFLQRPLILCFTQQTDEALRLFFDDYYPWDQRAQLALLFAKAVSPDRVDGHQVANALKENDVRRVEGLKGYLRPGDDGDFIEIGIGTQEELRRLKELLLDNF